MALEPLSIGVCSWSLQVTSIPELRRLLDRLDRVALVVEQHVGRVEVHL